MVSIFLALSLPGALDNCKYSLIQFPSLFQKVERIPVKQYPCCSTRNHMFAKQKATEAVE